MRLETMKNGIRTISRTITRTANVTANLSIRTARVIAGLDSFEWSMIVWIAGAFWILCTFADEGDDALWYWVSLVAPFWMLWGYYTQGKGKGKYRWTKDI